jgi:hypothetical protein
MVVTRSVKGSLRNAYHLRFGVSLGQLRVFSLDLRRGKRKLRLMRVEAAGVAAVCLQPCGRMRPHPPANGFALRRSHLPAISRGLFCRAPPDRFVYLVIKTSLRRQWTTDALGTRNRCAR